MICNPDGGFVVFMGEGRFSQNLERGNWMTDTEIIDLYFARSESAIEATCSA